MLRLDNLLNRLNRTISLVRIVTIQVNRYVGAMGSRKGMSRRTGTFIASSTELRYYCQY